jgi:hypothetical protein
MTAYVLGALFVAILLSSVGAYRAGRFGASGIGFVACSGVLVATALLALLR